MGMGEGARRYTAELAEEDERHKLGAELVMRVFDAAPAAVRIRAWEEGDAAMAVWWAMLTRAERERILAGKGR
jgi:hypothetical protein